MDITTTTCWAKRIPSFDPGVTGILEGALNERSKVFEFGTGGSTIWFAKRVGELVSVEYNPDWFQTLRGGFREDFGRVPPNVTLLLKSSFSDNKWLLSKTTKQQVGWRFVDSISEFPDYYFDLVVVDGRARMACMLKSRSKVKLGGIILLDDSQREHYRGGINLMSDWGGWMFDPGGTRKTMLFQREE